MFKVRVIAFFLLLLFGAKTGVAGNSIMLFNRIFHVVHPLCHHKTKSDKTKSAKHVTASPTTPPGVAVNCHETFLPVLTVTGLSWPSTRIKEGFYIRQFSPNIVLDKPFPPPKFYLS